MPVTRPHLSRTHLGLACGHVAPRPLTKVQPVRVPCSSCAAGRPAGKDVVEAMLREASGEERARWLELLKAS